MIAGENQTLLGTNLLCDVEINPCVAPRKTILVTVDLEDWFQVENLRTAYPHDTWDSCDLRVEMNTRILIDIFDHYKVRATFFVLGWVAERCPDLIKEIHNRGHEIACHGYDHRLCSQVSAKDLRNDLLKSKSILTEITGYPVVGYRAPGFSVTQRLIEILRGLNFLYDSSYNSFALNKRYGRMRDESWYRSSSGHLMHRNGLIELPISNLRFGRLILPWGGGGYLRMWPPSIFEKGIRQIMKQNDHYLFYMHPWEIDSVQPRVKQLSFLLKTRHYLNLSSSIHRVAHLLSVFQDEYAFSNCRRYLNRPEGQHGSTETGAFRNKTANPSPKPEA